MEIKIRRPVPKDNRFHSIYIDRDTFVAVPDNDDDAGDTTVLFWIKVKRDRMDYKISLIFFKYVVISTGTLRNNRNAAYERLDEIVEELGYTIMTPAEAEQEIYHHLNPYLT